MNGGIIASIIDCHCHNTANAEYVRETSQKMDEATSGYLTGMLNLKYLRPIPVKTVTLRAKIVEKKGKKMGISCQLYSGKQLCATGGITAVKIG